VWSFLLALDVTNLGKDVVKVLAMALGYARSLNNAGGDKPTQLPKLPRN